MFKIRTSIISGINFMLMLISWLCYKYPQGDEYLVLFMIGLVFMVAPYFVTPLVVGALFLANLVFLLFYLFMDILNPVDVAVMAAVFAACAGTNFLVKWLYDIFLSYHESNVRSEELRYNNIVNELDVIDRRGRKIENELNRMSRLYEITKQLAPALKFKDLHNALFAFLGENFRIEVMHLLVYSKGKFSKGISKDTGDADYYENEEKVLDYEGVSRICRERDNKPFFIAREEDGGLFDSLNVREDTFMAFPLFSGDELAAVLAIEGASKSSYGRFRILLPQIALEYRKVELYEQVQELSIIDGLTEVYLRRYLMDRLKEEVDRAQRLGLSFSLAMVDVDHFKQCNDRHGHLVGDAVLKKIAEKLKSSVREVDMIARYGGEEFCVVLPETTKELALSVAERLRKSVESKEIKAFDEKVKVTVSIGVSTYPEDGEQVESLIEKADTALYKAKRAGRNRVCQV
ncbi:MAG: diguanylate cyclase [Candidatus Omnitrophica bacterium]|nr:diguanylate cyclase [Candidatus Omnitrophota bacterium]